MKKNYRMRVEYDGTRYNGWQKQGDTDNTIQYKLEAILARMTGEELEIHGAGRTDAGVHARGQVAQFRAETELTPSAMRDYFNDYLPDDIGVTELEEAGPRFHSRYNASKKYYLYRVALSKEQHVFDRKYVYVWRGGKLDTGAMRRAAALLRGTHDFRSFCGNPHMKKSTVRTIYSIAIDHVGDEIRLGFTGDGFLQYMVRILVGTLLEVGEGKRTPESMEALLLARARAEAGPTAPAKGLTLMEVSYN